MSAVFATILFFASLALDTESPKVSTKEAECCQNCKKELAAIQRQLKTAQNDLARTQQDDINEFRVRLDKALHPPPPFTGLDGVRLKERNAVIQKGQ
jgi:hypothetical protein